jgi:hypothetical protein
LEFEEILSPKHYYLVLFDFIDLADPSVIRASIWQVDPRVPGFAYCMIDYYHNIRDKSSSKAPFNLWPFQLKFSLMRPILVYRARIDLATSEIQTEIFPGRDAPLMHHLEPLPSYAGSRNLSGGVALDLAGRLRIDQDLLAKAGSKKDLLQSLQGAAAASGVPPEVMADQLSAAIYLPAIRPFLDGLPRAIKHRLPAQ